MDMLNDLLQMNPRLFLMDNSVVHIMRDRQRVQCTQPICDALWRKLAEMAHTEPRIDEGLCLYYSQPKEQCEPNCLTLVKE